MLNDTSLNESNIKYESTNKYNSMINKLCMKAQESKLENKLAASIIQNNKMLTEPQCNIYKNLNNMCLNKVSTHSIHAEIHAIIKYYGKSFYYNKYKNYSNISNNKKNKKIDIIVVRVNKAGQLCNARPCYNCLCVMKLVGIKKVYYSTPTNSIICENVNNMISIQISTGTRHIDIYLYNEFKKVDIKKYYEFLLKKQLSTDINKYNFMIFFEYNMKILLPSYTFTISTGILEIYDSQGNQLIKTKIID